MRKHTFKLVASIIFIFLVSTNITKINGISFGSEVKASCGSYDCWDSLTPAPGSQTGTFRKECGDCNCKYVWIDEVSGTKSTCTISNPIEN
jgi:hypothetical protein